MKKREIIELAASQYELFLLYYLNSCTDGEKESIHQLRVSLKRFYALKKFLLQGMKPSGQAQLVYNLEPIRLVYKAGGKVRDLQVIFDVACSSAPDRAPQAFTNYLQELIQERLDAFIALSQKVQLPTHHEFIHNLKIHLDKFYRSYSGKLEQFLSENLKVACFYIQSTDPGELWHDARTLIKQNYLLMQLAVNHNQLRYSPDEIQYYRNLEQLLGEWHDWVVLKKYALRFELTRAFEMEAYLNQVSNSMHLLENTILETIGSINQN